jgi:hypothetical protein
LEGSGISITLSTGSVVRLSVAGMEVPMGACSVNDAVGTGRMTAVGVVAHPVMMNTARSRIE